jgi:hypothetical protein
MPKLKLNQHMRSIALCYEFVQTFEVQCLKMINMNEKCARNELESTPTCNQVFSDLV